MFKFKSLLVILSASLFACSLNGQKSEKLSDFKEDVVSTTFDTLTKTIHVFVALCDNTYQGIVPVPAAIGNGQNANSNLYWGCAFGVKSFFKKSKEWKLIRTQKDRGIVLERLVFKHTSKDIYLVADAYDGQFIKECTIRFLSSCAGIGKDTLHVNNKIIGINGNSKMLAYIGHDGLMDFSLNQSFTNTDGTKRDCIILACISKKYFAPHLKAANITPVLWSTGLMSPEAYTLHDALTGYVSNESSESIRNRGAKAYSKYQKCSIKAAQRLLVRGW